MVRSDYDSPWKEVIDAYFASFLLFLFPWIHKEIDWTVDYVSLEQELRKLAPWGELGKMLADKLVKVTTAEGDGRYLHAEVQGKEEDDFTRRVHTYNYRAEDSFGLPVVTVVVLADDDPEWRPCEYSSTVWGCTRTRAAQHREIPRVGRTAADAGRLRGPAGVKPTPADLPRSPSGGSTDHLPATVSRTFCAIIA
jgi:hypothetical protein